MRVKRLAFMVLMIMPNQAFSQELKSNDKIFKLIKPSNITRFSISNEQVKMTYVYSLNPNCTPLGKVSFRVTKKPVNGEINGVYENNFPSFEDNNPRSRCNSVSVPSLSIYYKSKEGYAGDDAAQVLIVYPNGDAELANYTIIVR